MTARPIAFSRRWTYAAPPWRIYQALTDEVDQWLKPTGDERIPAVVDASMNERVVYEPWIDEDIDDVEVVISTDDAVYGATLTVHARAKVEPTEARRKEARHRVGTLFGQQLRDWVDGG
jgi:hypothetical protein